MRTALATLAVSKLSRFTAKSFFSITALSMMLFLMLNIKIRTVLNEENGKQMSKLQIVFEFPFPLDDSPIHHDNDDDDILDSRHTTHTNHEHETINNVSDNNINNQSQIQPTPRDSFKYLFDTIPHACVMEQDCHLYMSDAPQFMNKTMVIVGMVRDSERDIIATLQQLDEIACIFGKIVFIFYESNSKDNTPYILEDWSAMYLEGTHCDHFRYNPATNASVTQEQRALIDTHRPRVIEKVLFHDFVDVRGKNRIVRFIIFRNMLLDKIKQMTLELDIDGFDYVMMIDLDIKEFDAKALFGDLNDSPYDILCANGLFKLEIMRDTFASVMANGTWLYTYHSLYDQHFKDLMYWPTQRFEPMNSCFGGLAVYKNSQRLLDTTCRYAILEEMKTEWEYSETYRNATGKERAWPKDRSWFLDEMYREPLIELVRKFYNANVKVGKERRKICEHLAYHYCLRTHNYTLAIARDATVYYFDFAKMANNPI
eukprot:111563_1